LLASTVENHVYSIAKSVSLRHMSEKCRLATSNASVKQKQAANWAD
jgi:hypothetical protein